MPFPPPPGGTVVRAYVGSGIGSAGAGAGGTGNYLPGYIRAIKAT